MSVIVVFWYSTQLLVLPGMPYGLITQPFFTSIVPQFEPTPLVMYLGLCESGNLRYCYSCSCQVVWQKWTNQIKIFLFHISINLFHSWHTFIKNKLMRISLFFTIVCQLRNKFMLMWNKNIFIPNVRICQTTWQQHRSL